MTEKENIIFFARIEELASERCINFAASTSKKREEARCLTDPCRSGHIGEREDKDERIVPTNSRSRRRTCRSLDLPRRGLRPVSSPPAGHHRLQRRGRAASASRSPSPPAGHRRVSTAIPSVRIAVGAAAVARGERWVRSHALFTSLGMQSTGPKQCF
jgi:hypothetical protein